MKKLLFSIAAFLCVSAAWADDGFVVSNIEIPQNGTVELEVGLNNSDNECAGFQFQLYLPEGISVTQENEEYLFTDGSRLSGKNFTTQISWDTDHYQILSYSGTVKTMTGTSGTIISIPLEVTGSFTVAQELNASLKVCKMTNKEEQSITLNDEIPFTITIGEPDDGRLKFYETSSTLPSYTAGGTADVTMYRTIKANEWSTIVLPFTLTKTKAEAVFGTDVELKEFSGFVVDYGEDEENTVPYGITLNFSTYTLGAKKSMIGGKPYLIRTKNDIDVIQANEVTLYNEVTDVTKDDIYSTTGKMTGTLVKSKVPSDGLFINNNKFWYSTGDTNVKAFRCWFELGAVLNKETTDFESRITFAFIDSEVTGIKSINSQIVNGKTYNLSGQQVKNPTKGLYIQDGKKVIIK